VIIPYIKKLSPTISPEQAFLRLQNLEGLLFLDGNTGSSEFSFLTADPFKIIEQPDLPKPSQGTNTLSVLKDEFRRWTVQPVPGIPPFQGGMAGVFGYGFSKHLEKLPEPKGGLIPSPEISVGFFDWVLAFDFKKKQAWMISTGFPETVEHLRAMRAQERADQIINLLNASLPSVKETTSKNKFNGTPLQYLKPDTLSRLYSNEHFFCDSSAIEYITAVQKCIDYIHAGDSFQINLSQRVWHPQICNDILLYQLLAQNSPAPFSCFMKTATGNIISASPERFLTLRDNKVVTSPIKGTRPRGKTEKEDQEFANSLLNSPKDRAENIMIVDLLRNDLGRVCSYGSIVVEELCKLESYSNVHHLVSKVTGSLKSEYDALDLLLACFPGGSVIGAPKIRSMEIIAELEQSPRGIYCGCMGYLGFEGSMDTNILIRTIFSSQGWLQFGAGGGIVADSMPQDEYQETLNKASGIIKAIRSHPDFAKLRQE